MSNKKMTRTEFYKGIMNLENYAPKKTPTQLPAELIIQIDKSAQDFYGIGNSDQQALQRAAYKKAARQYAVKLLEAQQEIESLTNQLKKQNEVQVENMKLLRKENERLIGWKSEASTLLDPILDYGQSKEVNIPLGESIIDKVLERCKRYDQSKQILKEAENFIKGITAFIGQTEKGEYLLTEIKTFLDGTK